MARRARRMAENGTAHVHRYRALGDPRYLQAAIREFLGAVELLPRGHPDRPGMQQGAGACFQLRFERSSDPDDLAAAVALFEEAIAADPPAELATMCRAGLGTCQVHAARRTADPARLRAALSVLRQVVDVSPPANPWRAEYLTCLELALRSGHELTGSRRCSTRRRPSCAQRLRRRCARARSPSTPSASSCGCAPSAAEPTSPRRSTCSPGRWPPPAPTRSTTTCTWAAWATRSWPPRCARTARLASLGAACWPSAAATRSRWPRRARCSGSRRRPTPHRPASGCWPPAAWGRPPRTPGRPCAPTRTRSRCCPGSRRAPSPAPTASTGSAGSPGCRPRPRRPRWTWCARSGPSSCRRPRAGSCWARPPARTATWARCTRPPRSSPRSSCGCAPPWKPPSWPGAAAPSSPRWPVGTRSRRRWPARTPPRGTPTCAAAALPRGGTRWWSGSARSRGWPAFAQPPFTQLAAAADGGPIVLVTATERRSDAIVLGVEPSVRVVALPALARADLLDRIAGAPGDVLAWTWDSIAGPVLDVCAPGPRLWWCPVGELAFLPLHAAAPAGGGPGVLDRVVSSYAPTIRSMRHPRRPRPAAGADTGALVVAMPRTPHAPDLPAAEEQAGRVAELVPGTRTLTGPDATAAPSSPRCPTTRWSTWPATSARTTPTRRAPRSCCTTTRATR